MAFALQTAGIFAVALKLTFASQSHLCDPCEVGISTKTNNEIRSCDHVVLLKDVKKNINDTINGLNKLIENIENKLNMVHTAAFKTQLQLPLAFPKVNRKVR
nr:uncharacterized protein LOC117686754 [Crassostrea gigas]